MPTPTTVNTSEAPQPIGPYSQAVSDGQNLWCCGQLGVQPGHSNLISDDVAKQCHQAMVNLECICRDASTSLENALRLTVYVTDLSDFARVNEVYTSFFEAPKFPARSCVQVAALPMGAKIEIDAVVAIH